MATITIGGVKMTPESSAEMRAKMQKWEDEAIAQHNRAHPNMPASSLSAEQYIEYILS